MTTAAIDLDILNELFDNQKKLDDIFSSMFDDDSFLSSSSSLDDQTFGNSAQKGSHERSSKDDWSFITEDKTFVQKSRGIFYFIMPLMLEIAVIFYGIMHFS